MSGAHAATLRLALRGRRNGRAPRRSGSRPRRIPRGSAALDAIFAAANSASCASSTATPSAPACAPVAAPPRICRASWRSIELSISEQGLHAKSDAWFDALAALDFGANGSVGLFFTEHEGDTVAGALTIRHGPLVTLYLAASAPAPRKYSKMVPCRSRAIEPGHSRISCDFLLGRRADDRRHRREAPVDRAVQARVLDLSRFELIGEHARWLF